MKTYFLLILIITTTTFKAMAKTETQKYKTIHQSGKFEIRYYSKATLATVNMNTNFDNMRSRAFRILANYIFGGNHENKKIAMTSPVRMSNTEESSSMSFVMPSKYEFEELPTPQTSSIILHQSKPMYMASLKFGGFANEKKIKEKEKELVEILRRMEIQHNGKFEYLGYNPPYQLFNRRNEVVVELVLFSPNLFNKIKTEY
jgi:hypothetical protein